MKKIIKQYKWFMISAILTLGIGLLLLTFFFKKEPLKVKAFENDDYTFFYDSSWQVEEQEEKVILKHGNHATVTIFLLTIEDDNKYKNIEELSKELLMGISKQNKEYSLLVKEDLRLSKNNYAGYQYLYESEDGEALIKIGKENDKLFFILYEADFSQFDILLDSVEGIVDDFTLKEKKIEFTSTLEIEVDSTPWEPNDRISTEEKKSYTVASSNYVVEVTFPKIFVLDLLNSRNLTFNYRVESGQFIRISSTVYPINIYSKLMTELGITYYEKEEEYKNYKKYLEKEIKNGKERYILKRTYTSLPFFEGMQESDDEKIIILDELDKNHILVTTIDASNIKVPKKLVDSIEILSSKNYAHYTTTTKKDKEKVFDFQAILSKNNDTIEKVTFTIPDRWEETFSDSLLDSNLYTERYFGIDYLKDLEYYQYSVSYLYIGVSYTTNQYYSYTFQDKLKSQLELDNREIERKEEYGKVKKLKFQGKVVENNREFYHYKTSYHDSSKRKINASYLYTETPNGFLRIIVEGENEKVRKSLFKEVTNFKVEEEKR